MSRRTGPDAKTCAVVMLRDAGRCRRCGEIGHQIQHRLARGSGGSRNPMVNNLSALVLVCLKCHDEIENRERAAAFRTGWAVKHGIERPSEIPLVDVRGRAFFLTEEGGVVYVTGNVPP